MSKFPGVDIDAVHGGRMKIDEVDAGFEKWWREHAYEEAGFVTSKGVARSAWHAALRGTTPPYVGWRPSSEEPARSMADESGAADGFAVSLMSPTFDGGPAVRGAWFDFAQGCFVCAATATTLRDRVLFWSIPPSISGSR
jgi:hypothetical protein